MAEEQWEEDIMIDYTQLPVDTSSFEQGHAPCRGKGRGMVPFNNNFGINHPVGKNSYNEGTNQESYGDNSYCGNRSSNTFNSNNSNRFGGNNGKRGNNRSRYRNNRDDGDGHDPRRQGNKNSRIDGQSINKTDETNDEYNRSYHNDRRDKLKKDREDNKSNGRGDGKNDRNKNYSGNDKNDNDEQKKREVYIPPEQPNDEGSLFGNDVTMGINFDKYDDIEVKVTGENAPHPIQTFRESGLNAILTQNIKKSGYKKPTPVQKYAIPMITSGRDLMACAQTGSGKTAAFVLPIIHAFLENPRDLIKMGSSCEPQAIIISPTRELTIQIYQQVLKFSHKCNLFSKLIYGGTSTAYQGNQIAVGCHILVATPGRLLDFLGRGRIRLSSLRFLVLDEADRMLDMGFLPDVEKIVDHETMVPAEERQTLMFSATFPNEIQELASRFLKNYLFLAVGIVGSACSDVEQNFYQTCGQCEKRKLLKDLIEKQSQIGSIDGILVFVEQKRHTDFIAAFLSESNFPTTSIHGDRLQREREEALTDFKRGKMSILVATAVAARGLDIKNVAHVINFDLPKTIDEYVHRIGRTGRVGNRGKATSFFDPDVDVPLTGDLVKILKQAGQSVPHWLLSSGGGGTRTFASGRGSRRFGGVDIRHNKDDYQSYDDEFQACGNASSVSAEPEEVW